MSGIEDRLNWDLKLRETYQTTVYNQRFFEFPAIFVQLNNHVAQFGFSNPTAKKSWRLGGTVFQVLEANPSSTSILPSNPIGYFQYCTCNKLNLIKFPDYGILPFFVQIQIPFWHKQMSVEVWEYSGDNFDLGNFTTN